MKKENKNTKGTPLYKRPTYIVGTLAVAIALVNSILSIFQLSEEAGHPPFWRSRADGFAHARCFQIQAGREVFHAACGHRNVFCAFGTSSIRFQT